MSEASEEKLIFGVGNEINYSNEQTWHQENIDIIIPVLIILTGVFQLVLRKWILPVSEDVISKLENQLPTQGLLYKPGFGISLIVIGSILLVFNL
ncbi:MAG: hypothetical protein KAT06_07590 [Gammaproteobacteria bacterium]|nr:hypothetical protein [Gammaproteobacteria bacterium]